MKTEVPVLIVGGGGAGLTCSMLLASLGIESLLVSSLPTTSILPKAHVLNQRAMEILADAGVADAIYAKGTPAENMKAMGWYAGFRGPEPEFGRLIGKLESWGHGCTNVNWVQASALRSANLPQIRLEPILKARAEQLNPGQVRFHHELIRLQQDADGVDAWIRNHDFRRRVRSQGALRPWLRRRAHRGQASRNRLRRPGYDHAYRDSACLGRPFETGA